MQKIKSWQTGTVVGQLSNRSYLVKTGTETIPRNRQFLKPQKQLANKAVPDSSANVKGPNVAIVNV